RARYAAANAVAVRSEDMAAPVLTLQPLGQYGELLGIGVCDADRAVVAGATGVRGGRVEEVADIEACRTHRFLRAHAALCAQLGMIRAYRHGALRMVRMCAPRIEKASELPVGILDRGDAFRRADAALVVGRVGIGE